MGPAARDAPRVVRSTVLPRLRADSPKEAGFDTGAGFGGAGDAGGAGAAFGTGRFHRVCQLSQATAVLKRIADRCIPVFGLEGNHDRAYYGEGSSWLEYLNSLGLLRLLRNDVAEDGSIILYPWEAGKPPGAYVDIGDIRIIGGRYYGASTPKAIGPMAEAIKALPQAPFSL